MTSFLGGYRVHVVPDPLPAHVKRSWRERLFSRPWRPWIAHKVVIKEHPMQEVLEGSALVVGSDLYVSVRQFEKLKKETSDD